MCAYDYGPCLQELVRPGVNGVLFTTADDCCDRLDSLCADYRSRTPLSSGLRKASPHRRARNVGRGLDRGSPLGSTWEPVTRRTSGGIARLALEQKAQVAYNCRVRRSHESPAPLPGESHDSDHRCRVRRLARCRIRPRPRDDTAEDHFGHRIPDPYRPLEDPNSDATKAWVEAENRLTFGYLEQIPERAAHPRAADEAVELRAVHAARRKKGPGTSTRRTTAFRTNRLSTRRRRSTRPAEVLIDPNTLVAGRHGRARQRAFHR